MNSSMDRNNLTILLPCHNEQDTVLKTILELNKNLNPLLEDYKIFYLFVDDGSIDNTWDIIASQSKSSDYIFGLKLSTNFGHQIALLAGIENALKFSDYILTMDADLQHPPEIARRMCEEMRNEKLDIINAQQARMINHNISLFKQVSSRYYYKFLKLIGVKIESRVGDFRLMTSKVAEALVSHNDLEFFARGIIARLGFKQRYIQYYAGKRIAGKTKYSFSKMLKLALSGITSTSIIPLRITFILSIILFLICLIMVIAAISTWINNKVVPGWTSIIISIYFLFGINFMILGVLGEYLGKNYRQSLGRPRYIIQDTTISYPELK